MNSTILCSVVYVSFSCWCCDGTEHEKEKRLQSPSEEMRQLVKQLSADKPKDRMQAAMRLGSIGPRARSAVPSLFRLLSDPNESVRLEVAEALGRIGDRSAIGPLSDTIKRDSRSGVRL